LVPISYARKRGKMNGYQCKELSLQPLVAPRRLRNLGACLIPGELRMRITWSRSSSLLRNFGSSLPNNTKHVYVLRLRATSGPKAPKLGRLPYLRASQTWITCSMRIARQRFATCVSRDYAHHGVDRNFGCPDSGEQAPQ
jgi:hypothetical protein